VSEDDFEDEAKREAKDYTALRKNQADRTHILEENRKRKQQGLDPLKLPPKRKRLPNTLDSGNDGDIGRLHTAYYRGSEDSDDPGPSNRKGKGREEALVYEGREYRHLLG
jgi:hypothetical protein